MSLGLGRKNNVHALEPGYRLGGYTIDHDIGSGGFGITYVATYAEKDGDGDGQRILRTVAIKELFPMDFVVRRGTEVVLKTPEDKPNFDLCLKTFDRECSILRQCRHPNIVRIFDDFRWNTTAYMVMEYLEDGTLTAYLKRLGGVLPESDILQILAPVLDAVECIHKLGYLHRDIAPDNILLSNGFPILVDFGCAKSEVDAKIAGQNTGVIKMRYSPFEQYTRDNSQVGPWSDIYALAATTHYMITGALPPEAPSRIRSTLKGVQETDPYAQLGRQNRQFRNYCRELRCAVDWGLEVRPEDRPQSIAEWRQAFPPLPRTQALLRAESRSAQPARQESSSHEKFAGTLRLPHDRSDQPRAPSAAFQILVFLGALLVICALLAWYLSSQNHLPWKP